MTTGDRLKPRGSRFGGNEPSLGLSRSWGSQKVLKIVSPTIVLFEQPFRAAVSPWVSRGFLEGSPERMGEFPVEKSNPGFCFAGFRASRPQLEERQAADAAGAAAALQAASCGASPRGAGAAA